MSFKMKERERLPFNKSLDLTLIALVKENAILYNTKHPKYADYEAREVAWQKISDKIGRPGAKCKSRWINIRDMMRRKLKERLKNPPQSAIHYKYEEELSFMTPFFRDFTEDAGSEDLAEFLEDEASGEVEMPEEVFVVDGMDEYEHETKPNMKRKHEESYNEHALPLNSADPLEVFLMTIGSTMRSFSPYYLNQAKSKIFQVVQDYELKQIVGKDDKPGSSSAR
ncbi:uncharacterized protein LOC135084021 [Ostrinia nubilalis]|uniref:uncharacterized protein LOC135084021 n=1 Tax=Ostrinia nubilalis TaxID=29057 RepID=UPI0030824C0C